MAAKNDKFFWLLHEPRGADRRPLWTVEKIADDLGMSRPRLHDTFNNKPGHGGRTRPRLVRWLAEHYPKTWREILAALKWNERGELLEKQNVPRGTFHVERT